MKDIEFINFKSKKLTINQDENGNRKEYCYSDDGDCRECRCYRDCEWFLHVNGYSDRH